MKRIITMIMMVMTLVFTIEAAGKGKAKISFEETTFDFGNIREDGGKVTHEFIFTNKGDEPLLINSARAECGCTRPEYPREAIAPGKKGVITVTYNPLGRPGGFTKVVTVRCSGSPGKINLKIRGTVLPKNK